MKVRGSVGVFVSKDELFNVTVTAICATYSLSPKTYFSGGTFIDFDIRYRITDPAMVITFSDWTYPAVCAPITYTLTCLVITGPIIVFNPALR